MGGGDWYGSARYGVEVRFGSGEARSAEQASQMAQDLVEGGGYFGAGFSAATAPGQYQTGWGAGASAPFGQSQSSGG